MVYELIVVGGGAAGMMAAITAAESGKKVIIIEKMNRLGKKILATGNGRCNFTNSYLDEQCYRGCQSHFPYLALEQFDHADTIAFFHRLGIAVTEKNGYYYPRSNQAASIADTLVSKVESLSIEVLLECKVIRAEKRNGIFYVSSSKIKVRGRNLLIAAGGQAQEKLGSDGTGFWLAEQFGHHLIELFPALTALEVKRHFLREANGVRTQCKAGVILEETRITREQGELQITKYGVSGVMIFQISRYVIEGIRSGKRAFLELDFLPEMTDKQLFFDQMKEYSSFKTVVQWLEGFFPGKLAVALARQANLSPEKKTDALSKKEKDNLWRMIKQCRIGISGWKGFDYAQVTAGGVDTTEVSPYTMESELVPGLYFAGEVLDVDGTCGGYNLQWAWTSGYLAGRSVQ